MTKIMQNKEERFLLPDVPSPSLSLYMKWGEKKMRQLVRYHHYLLQLHDPYLLPSDLIQFQLMSEKTSDYIIETFSRGKFSDSPFRFPAVKMRFFQKTIDEDTRDLWLDMYKKAMMDCKMPSECIEEFWSWIEPMSVWMINRKTKKSIPRYPYREIWTDFVEFKQMNRCS